MLVKSIQLIMTATVLFVCTLFNLVSAEQEDVINLKNGTKFVGKIIESDVKNVIKIRTSDSIVYNIKQNEIESIELQSGNVIAYNKNTKSELGITIGTPSGLNLVLGVHQDKTMFKISGMYLGDAAKGIQFEIGYKLKEFANTYHAISLVGGVSQLRAERKNYYYDYDKYEYKNWSYIGLVYNLNTNGFYLQPGLSVGSGDFSSPQLMLQIGYVYQFRN